MQTRQPIVSALKQLTLWRKSLVLAKAVLPGNRNGTGQESQSLRLLCEFGPLLNGDLFSCTEYPLGKCEHRNHWCFTNHSVACIVMYSVACDRKLTWAFLGKRMWAWWLLKVKYIIFTACSFQAKQESCSSLFFHFYPLPSPHFVFFLTANFWDESACPALLMYTILIWGRWNTFILLTPGPGHFQPNLIGQAVFFQVKERWFPKGNNYR